MFYSIKKTLHISCLFSQQTCDKILLQLLGIRLKQDVHSRPEFFWAPLCPESPGILCTSNFRLKLLAASPWILLLLETWAQTLRTRDQIWSWSLKGTGVEGQLKDLQKQSGPSSQLRERPRQTAAFWEFTPAAAEFILYFALRRIWLWSERAIWRSI